mmetsp:Transcript_20892/g.25109  ORF Transcript_20892/g.25109 Transcript_20892/m.25109 type:complete len:197 (-) Transcript_20892:381-971(-)|eukprot:CAMPEP_0197849906 /NCGR_PEP_ID=MMETSP1438-20131217/13626_1 /TAXON_ID=1461541 /ORGANISM="Pterosperma sp., Strain CCMP1384" /LENGTH=196 /DNA_ID=CAMNT_0043462805 /DNA_START=129 /DNA_END=719 /DNA_ORIENTATION=-
MSLVAAAQQQVSQRAPGSGAKLPRNLNPVVFFDIAVAGAPVGRIEMELRADVCPRTCENFRSLCTGEKGDGKHGKPLWFKGTPFHRVIPHFMCQGGDILTGDGNGGESIFGWQFQDENFELSHNSQGVLSMANKGPHTNSSQFFITTMACPWLDNKHTVFGMVKSGYEVVQKIEALGSAHGETTRPVIIEDCGQLY